jgi:hypothetical protein
MHSCQFLLQNLLLSTGKKIRFRPFTVKEEKLFLMAAEAGDLKSITDTVKQVINN